MPLHRRHGFVLLLLAAGCAAGDAADEEAFTVQDSAGVVIVQNARAAWSEGDAWRIADVPELEIGTAEGAPEYQLFRARSARRLENGRVLVVNAGTQEIRTYDPDGKHLRTLGREGGGPGEFRGLTDAFGWAGDSILAFDLRTSTARVFAPDGMAGRSFHAGGGTGRDRIIAVVGDSALVTTRTGGFSPGPHTQHIDLFHRDARGGAVDSVGRFPLIRIIPERRNENTIVMGGEIFGARTQIAVAGERVFIAMGRAPEVEVRALDGTLLRLVRWSDPDRVVREEHRSAFTEERLAAVEDPADVPTWRTRLAAAEWASEFPAVSAVLADGAGNLWVQPHARPGGGEPPWRVFDPEGRLLGEVPLPDGFTPHEIGADHLLGMAYDDLGVQRVRLYRLVKP